MLKFWAQQIKTDEHIKVWSYVIYVGFKSGFVHIIANCGQLNFQILSFLSPNDWTRSTNLHTRCCYVLIVENHFSLHKICCVSLLIQTSWIEPCPRHFSPSPRYEQLIQRWTSKRQFNTLKMTLYNVTNPRFQIHSLHRKVNQHICVPNVSRVRPISRTIMLSLLTST